MTAGQASSPMPRKPGHFTIRTRFFDARVNYKVLLYSLCAFGILAAIATWAMSLGSYPISMADVMRATVGQGADDHSFIVHTLRLPRVITAMLVGMALAMSGAIFQGLVRNPLVSPDIIGINTGATVFAVFWIVTGGSSTFLPVGAFAGALLTAGIVYGLSWKGGIAPSRLILVGIGVSACLSAATTYATVKFPIEQVRPAIVWTMGSIYGSTWGDVRILVASMAVLVPAAIGLTWPLRTLQLGDDVSRGLGVPVELTRLSLIVVGCGLAAVVVSIAGPIGFVALMVPHIARMLAGSLSGSVMLFTGILGGCFLLASDVVAQHFLPVALPVGVVTSAVGAPYFLFLLYRTNVRM
jgi:iron complex transport system permease protein